jgi:hypothetical protein
MYVIPAIQENIKRSITVHAGPGIERDLISKITNIERGGEWLK